MFRSAGVRVGAAGVHMCATMIATLHSRKTNTSREPYIHWRGSFINQTAVHLSTHSSCSFPCLGLQGGPALPRILEVQREGSEPEKIRDSGVKRVGRRGETGRKWRNSGRLTFQRTAVLSQVLVLSEHALLFFLFFFPCVSHDLVPGEQQQATGQRFMWQEAGAADWEKHVSR